MDAAAAAARRFASSGLTALSHGLTKQFCAANGMGRTSNLVFSPLSIHSALSLLAAGGKGRTLSELLGLLGARSREELAENVRGLVERAFPASPQPGGPLVAFASGLWHDATVALKPSYRDVAATSCRATVHAVDFMKKPDEAAEQINSWVAAATRNLIDSIVNSGSVHGVPLVVVNAVYFKGIWETPFEERRTREDKFHRLDGRAVDAKFMSSSKEQFVAEHDGFKVLRMPYKMPDPPNDGAPPPRQYSMCVLLPDARDGLWSLLDRIQSSPDFLRDHLPKKRVDVGKFLVPKFKLEFSTGLNPVLQELGIKAVFSMQQAELPDMLEGKVPLCLGAAIHKAVIEVNEEGTEAAAVTALLMFGCSRQKDRPVLVDFVADHPFAFFVVEEVSGAILFAGHVLDPTDS